jgi:hypothetical protein
VVKYARDVGPGDSGVRVSLRRELPEGGYGDVLGQLLSWTDVVQIERRDGVIVEVPAATVVAAKKVPPAPERR